MDPKRTIRKMIKRKLRVTDSAIHGMGLYATTAIKGGTVLGYCRTKKTKEPNDHTLWLDSGPVDVICRLKYINHSPTPNVAYHDELSVVALRDVQAGEELTHHYGEEWES
jgi:hypothetical protein